MINQRLFDHYNIDTKKNLQIKKICSRPYDTILIDKNGSCYACECTSWLPQSVGNLQLKSLDEIINSKMQQHLQSSVADGTYRYCNENQCSYIRLNYLLNIDNAVTQIKHLRLAIDDSCNLQCPSCRTKLIFHKEGSQFRKGIRLANKINDWLSTYNKPIQVHIGSDGDPLASHVYRYFMENTPKRKMIQYSILTNGLMFKDFHLRIPHIIKNLNQLGVSIDGATKETYEKLRLGGKWANIIRNLKCIAELKKQHNFKFILNFVIQKDNYHEMEKIIQLGKKYNADWVWLNKIENWNTMEDFDSVNVIDPQHPKHTDYQKQLKHIQPYNEIFPNWIDSTMYGINVKTPDKSS